jgi:nitrous oxide reductase accessory protein NosL
MKKCILLFFAVCCCFCSFEVFANDDLKEFPSCKYCGMDRQRFASSRVVIAYEDGTTVGTCSLHCAAVDLAINIDKTPKQLLIADYSTKELIDFDKAFWILGGNKPGVRTGRAKWAFAESKSAENFLKVNGGILVNPDQVFRCAYEDMHADTQMIREKRKLKRIKMQMQSGPHPQH